MDEAINSVLEQKKRKIAFSFADCQGGLCKCKDFIPKDLDCPPIAHHIAICKLRKLLEEPLSQKSYNIHSYYLNNFMGSCSQGFYINDMPFLTRVIEILAERIESAGTYRRYLKKILKVAALMPLVYSDADKIDGVIHFGKYLSVLGLLGIWLKEQKLRLYVYNALLELLTNSTRIYVNSVEINFRFIAVENSHLPEIVTQLIEIVGIDEYDYILKIALALTQISNVTCKKMMVTNAVNFLLMRLLPSENNPTDIAYVTNLPKSKEFLITCDISCHVLINLVASLKKETNEANLNQVTPTENLLWAVRYLLRGLLYNGIYTRNVRNMLLEFILHCLEVFPSMEIFSSYLATDLAELSVATESDKTEGWLCDVRFENHPDDVCFKKMLLMSLCYIEKYPLLEMIYENTKVIKGLLKLISPNYKTLWHPKDQESIRNFALIALNCITPLMIRNFYEHDGLYSILETIEPYTVPSMFYKQEELLDLLKILKKVADNSANIFIYPELKTKAFNLLSKLCSDILEAEILTYDDQKILTHCFSVLHYFNNIDDDNDSIDKNVCPCPNSENCSCCPIKLPVNYLRRILKPNINDSVVNSRTVVGAINYLWTILLLKKRILDDFIKMEGVYLLLDVVDICVLPVQVIGLGCLVEIVSETQYSLPFILTWRGVKDKKQIFISLLARIFRDECRKIGTRLNENDIITDIFHPLMGRIQYQQVVLNDNNFDPVNALADMLGSARPKIYALLQILNTRYENNVNLINEHYKIGMAPVQRNDLIILHLANNFFALKLSEAWHELSQSLLVAGIDPIDLDSQMICNLTEKMQKWNEGVQKNQEIILSLEIKKDLNLEARLYEIFRESRLQYAIDALRELKFFARTTDRMFREAHKNKQKVRIESDKYRTNCSVYYETFLTNLNSTATYNMEFVIPNNKIMK